MRPHLIALLLASCGIVGPSAEEQEALTRYQQNAKLYWEGGKLQQAEAMIQRGLEIDGDDYNLNTLRAYIRLRRSKDDDSLLDAALEAFQRVMAMRSDYQHQPNALLGYAMTLQALGMRNITEANRLREAGRRIDPTEPEAAVLLKQAEEHGRRGRSFLISARKYLDVLLDKGELVMLSHYHMMQIATSLGETAALLSEIATVLGNTEVAETEQRIAVEENNATFRHGDAYLEELRRARQAVHDELERTATIGYERELRSQLQKLREDEILARTYLADIHYQRQDYEEAVAHLDIVLEMDPTRSADYYNRGRCLRELGKIDAAKADFRKFLATSPLPAGNPKKTDAVKALEVR